MVNVVRWTETQVGSGFASLVFLAFSDEQYDICVAFSLLNVTLASWCCRRRVILRFPVKEGWRDRIVIVVGGIGIIALRFVECHEKEIRFCFLVPENALSRN